MPDAEADEIFSVYRELYESAWRLFPDVVDTLNALSRCRLGVISNGSSVQQRRKLAAVGVLDRFAVVAVSEDVGVAKPHARIFKAACQAVGRRTVGVHARGEINWTGTRLEPAKRDSGAFGLTDAARVMGRRASRRSRGLLSCHHWSSRRSNRFCGVCKSLT